MSRSWLMASVAATVVIAALAAAAGSEAGPTAFQGRNGTILAGGGVKGKLYALSADGRRRTEIRGVARPKAVVKRPGRRTARRSPSSAAAAASISPTRPVGISTHRAGGSQAAWSPDGSQILFTEADWLHVVRADGPAAFAASSPAGTCSGAGRDADRICVSREI